MKGEIKILRHINLMDFVCLMIVMLSLCGFFLAKAGHAGVNKVIHGTARINIDVYFSGIKTKDVDLFKVGEPAALTIRNQPVYPPMIIVAVKHWPKLATFLAPDGKKAIALPDPSQTLAHDYVVTVSDTAEISNDGYVIRGNKLKVGNTVELESFKYRMQGVVVDINPANK